MKKRLPKISVLALLILSISSFAQTGTWTQVTTHAPHRNSGVCLLLTDGRVMCKSYGGSGNYGTVWDILTPDATGSYINGTWSSTAAMNYDRLFFSSQVLPSGKVYVAGGEYSSYPSANAGDTKGEVYDPVADTWTVCGAMPGTDNVYDGNSQLLYNGEVLEGPQLPSPSENSMLWSPTTLNYTAGPVAPYNHDETAWLKLPDSSVLYVGINSDNSCRYMPKTNTWFTDANTPNNLYSVGSEAGCALMLPNGEGIFFGATKYNNIYTPTGHATAGTWAAAADLPIIGTAQTSQFDAPGAMMVNGKILLGVSPAPSGATDFHGPIWWLEYDYSVGIGGTFTQVNGVIPGFGADSIAGVPCNFGQLLDLPNGTVLMSVCQEGFSDTYWVYTPVGGPIPQGKPTLTSIIPKGCPNFMFTGKLFNGISEGAGFGDDWQMSTNYPLVRFFTATTAYYAKTTNWNRVGAVQTGNALDTAYFELPSNLLPGTTYSVVVTVNGFASDTLLFTTLGITIPTATNVSCFGGSNGSATASAPVGGTAPYTYAWSGVSGTTLSVSGLSSGTYTINVTDNNGCQASAIVNIGQPAAPLSVTQDSVSVNSTGACNGQAQVNVSGGTPGYTYSWSPGGGTNDTISGKCKGTYCCSIKDNNGCTASTCVHIENVTGVPNISNTSNINIYPDPNSGSFTVAGITIGQVIELYNNLGQKLSSTIANNTTMYFDISSKADGIYLVRILNKDGSVVTQNKIMKAQ